MLSVLLIKKPNEQLFLLCVSDWWALTASLHSMTQKITDRSLYVSSLALSKIRKEKSFWLLLFWYANNVLYIHACLKTGYVEQCLNVLELQWITITCQQMMPELESGVKVMFSQLFLFHDKWCSQETSWGWPRTWSWEKASWF